MMFWYFLAKITHRDFSAGEVMEFDLRFTDKEITAWGGDHETDAGSPGF